MAYTEGCVSLPGRHRQDGISHRKLGKYVETVNRGIDMKHDYRQFYALLKQHPSVDKDELVLQFTDGRTSSLREMKEGGYMQRIKLGTK